MFLVMMYLGTGQRVGISTGTFILLIEIYRENYYTSSVTFILHPHQHMQRFPSSFMVSRRLLSESGFPRLIIETVDNTLFCFFRKTHHDPIKTRSAVDGWETCLKLYCNCGPGDNPAQSEVCGHIRSEEH